MASEQSTDRIIDLIYGELPEEEEEQMRHELAESAELRAELDSYEDLLQRVRTTMPAEEPSPSVHASIMEAARAGAENASQRRVARRSPDGAAPRGVWGRLSNSNIAQIATVAAVLLAGVFVVKFVDRGADPTMAPASDISAAREPAPRAAQRMVAEADQNEKGVEEAEDGLAMATDKAEASGGEEQPDVWKPAEQKPADEPVEAIAAAEEEASIAGKLGSKREHNVRRDALEKKKRRKRPAPKPRQRQTTARAPKKDSAKSGMLDMLEADSDTTTSSGTAVDSKNRYGAGEDAVVQPETEQAKKAEAEAEPAPVAKESQEYRAQAGTISAVEQQWRTRDYTGTVRAADDFLQSGGGTNTDKARAMQLKAQAYYELGRYRQAERLYAAIQKNYPSYQTSQINASRAEAKSRMEKKPARKRRSRPSKSQDDTEMMLDEAAPTSLD
jgi:hypothetical protein